MRRRKKKKDLGFYEFHDVDVVAYNALLHNGIYTIERVLAIKDWRDLRDIRGLDYKRINYLYHWLTNDREIEPTGWMIGWEEWKVKMRMKQPFIFLRYFSDECN